MRYTIMIGHDWQGDAYWEVHDRHLRLTVCRFDSREEAQAFIADPRL